MLDKKGVYALLDERKIDYERFEHIPVYTIEEMYALDMPHKERIVKNLFLRDDKKQNFYMVTLPGNKSINLKNLAEKINSRKLSFANKELLREMLGLEKGHVTPLGVLNNAEKNVIMVFDSELRGQVIGIHPMENTATVFVKFEDVRRLIEENGNRVVMCEL